VYHFMGACGSGKTTVLNIMRRRGIANRVIEWLGAM
jgi:predicted ATPase